MPEPTSSGVAGAAAFKAAGGAAARGALLSAIVVMLMTPPRSTREWAVGLISTVVTGISGGAIAVQYFRLQEWVDSVTGLVALGGLILGCGLPGWAIVRWVFHCIELNRDAGIDDVVKEVKEAGDFIGRIRSAVKMQHMHSYFDKMHSRHLSGVLHVAITSISELIKTARDGRSQAEFARDMGVTQSTLSRYERGYANPKAEVIERCMRLVHWGNRETEPSVDQLVDKVRAQLSREDQAPLRVALSNLIDGLAAEKSEARTI